jgi:hypothetical protein
MPTPLNMRDEMLRDEVKPALCGTDGRFQPASLKGFVSVLILDYGVSWLMKS